jgi:hypothetical protein
MRRDLLLLATLTAVSALAHHSYGDYNRDTLVALEGTIKQVSWEIHMSCSHYKPRIRASIP